MPATGAASPGEFPRLSASRSWASACGPIPSVPWSPCWPAGWASIRPSFPPRSSAPWLTPPDWSSTSQPPSCSWLECHTEAGLAITVSEEEGVDPEVRLGRKADRRRLRGRDGLHGLGMRCQELLDGFWLGRIRAAPGQGLEEGQEVLRGRDCESIVGVGDDVGAAPLGEMKADGQAMWVGARCAVRHGG